MSREGKATPSASAAGTQKPEHLIIGSLRPGDPLPFTALDQWAQRAESAGCQAIRLTLARALTPAMLEEAARRWLGRLTVVADVVDLAGVENVMCLDGITMLGVPAAAAADPRLVQRVAAAPLPALLEANALSCEALEDACRRFAPGQLTLLWSQIHARSAVLDTVEDLFSLLRLRRHGRPVGYVATSRDLVAAAVAIGFGAVVLDIPLAEDAGLLLDACDLKALVLRLRRAEDEADGQLLRSSDLDVVDERRASLVAARSIREGETLTPDMLTCKTPYRGLSPGLLPFILGRRVLYDIPRDEPITFGVIEL